MGRGFGLGFPLRLPRCDFVRLENLIWADWVLNLKFFGGNPNLNCPAWNFFELGFRDYYFYCLGLDIKGNSGRLLILGRGLAKCGTIGNQERPFYRR